MKFKRLVMDVPKYPLVTKHGVKCFPVSPNTKLKSTDYFTPVILESGQFSLVRTKNLSKAV